MDAGFPSRFPGPDLGPPGLRFDVLVERATRPPLAVAGFLPRNAEEDFGLGLGLGLGLGFVLGLSLNLERVGSWEPAQHP